MYLWPIGNRQIRARIDRWGGMVWACLRRVDGERSFSALLSDDVYAEPQARGYWAIELEGVTSITQEYVRNTPILRTRQMDDQGNIVETLDFCPRFKRDRKSTRLNSSH